MGRVEIKESLIELLSGAKNEMAKFNKKSYPDTFDAMYHKYAKTLGEIENLYKEENENPELFEDIASAISTYALDEVNATKKRNKSVAMIDFNMAMVTFILPIFAQREEKFMKDFSEKCVEEWNKAFPKNKIQNSTRETIQGGFKTNLCYITTAVCGSQNKADDCYELNLLRNYRDEYLMHEAKDGASLVKEYYDIAPTIVKRIDKEEESASIYQEIWEEYLNPCIQFIETGDNEKSKELYTSMVETLSTKYLH